MAGYNPQRERPRPVLADDAPAPVDALLGAAIEEPVVAPAVELSVESPAESPTDPAVEPAVDSVAAPVEEAADGDPATTITAEPVAQSAPVPEAPYVPTQTSAAERSRTRLLLLVAAGVTAAVVAVMLRRRRG